MKINANCLIPVALSALLVALKAAAIIEIPWWLALLPIWLPPVGAVLGTGLAVLVVGLVYALVLVLILFRSSDLETPEKDSGQ